MGPTRRGVFLLKNARAFSRAFSRREKLLFENQFILGTTTISIGNTSMEIKLLTAKGHHQGEEYHSPYRQKQAASLISEGPLTGPEGQTYALAHCAADDSC